MFEEWDFEAEFTFIPPEQGGYRVRPRMGWRPDFRYPEFDDGMAFMIWPVAAFHANGDPYEDAEPFAPVVWARFFVLSRDLFESVHRPRLVSGRRFVLGEGSHLRAEGEVIALRDLS